MRSVLVVALLAAVPAYADTPPAQPDSKAAPRPDSKAAPRPNGQPWVLPPATLQDVLPRIPPNAPDTATGGRSIDGGFSAGIVIEPPPHPDARPWPEGIAMTPPDVKDPIAMGVRAPAAEPLRAAALWSKRLAEAIQDRLGKIVQLALPRSL